MDERWLPVVGYEGFYEVSSGGDIRSLPREVASSYGSSQVRPGRVLKQSPQTNGYLIVSLARGGQKKTRTVHRVVCEAFHGPAAAGMDAAHTNGDRTDNRAENLYWATRSENISDQVEHGTHHFSRRDRCNAGHLYTSESTGTYPSYRGRFCIPCQKGRKEKSRGIPEK